jgi:hypothetical protein
MNLLSRHALAASAIVALAALGTVPAQAATPPSLYFSTPQAAMTYLAAAYNSDNVADLHYVTTPAAFANLMAIRSDMIHLRLRYCSATGRGDYDCYFSGDYPKHLHMKGHQAAEYIAAPALRQGWYLYFYQGCD